MRNFPLITLNYLALHFYSFLGSCIRLWPIAKLLCICACSFSLRIPSSVSLVTLLFSPLPPALSSSLVVPVLHFFHYQLLQCNQLFLSSQLAFQSHPRHQPTSVTLFTTSGRGATRVFLSKY